MRILLMLLSLFGLVAAILLGGWLLRAVLPRGHALQSRLTNEAIANCAHVAAKNFKGILAVLLAIYFLVVGFLYG